MKYVINQLGANGSIKPVATYYNGLTAYQNMLSFAMLKARTTGGYRYSNELVDIIKSRLSSSSHFFYYEDEIGNLYSLRKY